MKKLNFIFLFLFVISCSFSLKSQDIAPQIWSNASVAWNINNHYAWRNSIAYNRLLSAEFPWDEFTITSTGVFKFKQFFEGSMGFYFARTQQSISLNSIELRPFVGFRAQTNSNKRWLISNLFRFEVRQMLYSDVSGSISARFRNQLYMGFSLNKKSVAVVTNNFVLYGYIEVFLNMGQEVRERFFTLFKYKIGLAYRVNKSWGVNVGMIYQDAKNNAPVPVPLPTKMITNYVFDWGVVYVIPYPEKIKGETQ